MAKWIKPNGTKIETNDQPETIAVAKALGWKSDKPVKKSDKKKASKKKA